MAYDLKNVFYLGNLQEYPDSITSSGESVQPIDVSAYVDPISKGRAKGQGLAVYRVHCSVSTTAGAPCLAAETAAFTVGLSVKPYTSTGDGLTGVIAYGDLSPSSDLLIYGQEFIGQASGEGSPQLRPAFCAPSEKVPYVVVRDTIFQTMHASVAFEADVLTTFRMECAMISLDTATLNQLLRTQTA